MNVSLEINLGDLLKFYKINQRSNGKVILDIIITKDLTNEIRTDQQELCSLLFENTESFYSFLLLSFEEVEERIVEYVVLLEDYNKNIHYSKYYNNIYYVKEAMKEIGKLCKLSLNIKKYNKTDLKEICYSYIPPEEDMFNIPIRLKRD